MSIGVTVQVSENTVKKKFFVELIKPSNYDDDGYVLQWYRSFSISNSLACILGLTTDAARQKVLGDDVEIVVNVYDDQNIVIPNRKIIKRIKRNAGKGVVFLVGVQTNQFPRAVDIARPFCAAGIPVVIGGFHVSGSLAMLPDMPGELQEALDLGITLFAGEAETRLETLFCDLYHGAVKPVYNYLGDLPALENQPTPLLPQELIKKTIGFDITLDTSRGCPFKCSFCSVINVQGTKSRFRATSDVEGIIRAYRANGRKNRNRNFFFTDDNFARNKNWEAIFDRLIDLREKEGLRIKFSMQIDSQAYKIPRFIDKAGRAGCKMVFIGMESVNPKNLEAAHKNQNKISEYQEMLQAWHNKQIVTMAGYILGFPFDTPESIERDIKTIQDDLAIDVLMFFSLTPLPGSQDHQEMVRQGVWMDPDLNRYDSIHVTIDHPRMTQDEWKGVFHRAWDLFYSKEHVEKLMRRAIRDGIGPSRLIWRMVLGHCAMKYENIHPFQMGVVRRKIRSLRRNGMRRENPFVFYPRRVWETLHSLTGLGWYAWRVSRIAHRLHREMQRG